MKSFEDIDRFITEEVKATSAMHVTERRALYDVCHLVPKDGTVVEVGCQLGCSSAIISSVGYDRKYRTIHIDPYTQQDEYMRGWTDMMLKLTGDWDHAFCLLCMRTEQAAWYLERLLVDGIDLAFIDGDHLENGVRADMELVAARVKVGGCLLAHDYTEWQYPGVAVSVDRFLSSGRWIRGGQYHSMGEWRRRI